jgi:hypothetical protein
MRLFVMALLLPLAVLAAEVRITLPPGACCIYDPERHIMTCQIPCEVRNER